MPRKGYKQSEEHKRKMRETLSKVCRGRKLSEECKQKLREAHLGKKQSEEHKKKLSSVRKGKKPSEITKQKISKTLLGKNVGRKMSDAQKQKLSAIWKPSNKNLRGKNGYYNDILYQSSYELHFMKLLDEYKIPYERADNKKFRVKYIFENQEKFYYPDFYLPREGSIVEIKPFYKLAESRTEAKLNAAREIYGENFIVITEQELPELRNFEGVEQ